MIPKILHFIWFGDNVPNYAKYVMDMYKKVNPGFVINFVHEKGVKTSKNQDIAKCRESINDRGSIYFAIFNGKHFKSAQDKNKTIFNTAFSDAFRYFLLNKYGGIYLDLDTWPVEPFDDWLMNLDYFQAQSHKFNDPGKTYPDIFFIGSNGVLEVYPRTPSNIFGIETSPILLPVDYRSYNLKQRRILSQKLKNCEIRYGEYYCNKPHLYINHMNCLKTDNWYKELNKIQQYDIFQQPQSINKKTGFPFL